MTGFSASSLPIFEGAHTPEEVEGVKGCQEEAGEELRTDGCPGSRAAHGEAALPAGLPVRTHRREEATVHREPVVLLAVTIDEKQYQTSQYSPVYIKKAFELLLTRSRANQRQDKI